jgi:hypothetical protein
MVIWGSRGAVTGRGVPRYQRSPVPTLLSIAFTIVAPVVLPASAPPTVAPPTVTAPRPLRRYGLHLGLNATLTFDATIGRYVYAGATTQLTGLGALADSERNYVVSALVFGGVALPLVERDSLRLTADVTPAVGFIHSAPVNFVTVGLLAGVRLVHRTGFTAAIHLPLVGYAGAPQARRGSVYYYYLSAIPTVPLITVGYTF